MSHVATLGPPAASQVIPQDSWAWARRVNGLLSAQFPTSSRSHATTAVRPGALLEAPPPGSSTPGLLEPVRLSTTTAEALVRLGLKPTLLGELAAASGLDARHLHEFVGLDRTTVARRSARDDVLPHEAAVKALEFAELVATAADVFGTVADAARWLARPHPVLDGETPLRRARTPWGLARVRSMLGALKYGAPV